MDVDSQVRRLRFLSHRHMAGLGKNVIMRIWVTDAGPGSGDGGDVRGVNVHLSSNDELNANWGVN
jgi:hypothetical protein